MRPSTFRLTTENRSVIGACPLHQKTKRADLCYQHKSTLDPQPSHERMKIMATDTSAVEREQTPHTNNSTNNQTISDSLKRRAQSVKRVVRNQLACDLKPRRFPPPVSHDARSKTKVSVLLRRSSNIEFFKLLIARFAYTISP